MLNKAALFQALCAPLAISQRGWRALAVAAARADLSASSLPSGVVADKQSEQGVAVIDISGPLEKEDSIWQLFFGGTSYAKIRRELEAAVFNEYVTAVVLNVDSPGGAVFGCSELAGAIYAARDIKPVYAYISGQGDSAAYWIASAADEVIINATGEAGSIGVRCALIDDSEFLSSLGIKEFDIVADQSPLKVIDPSKAEDRARVKAEMTEFASVFVADVAKHRNVTVQKVLSDFGRGGVMVGQSAVDAGLADRVGNLEDVIAELSLNKPDNEVLMRISKENAAAAAAAAAPAASMSNGKCSQCKADMDDGDPSYCKSCMDDSSKAESFIKDVCALTGAESPAAAMGALVAMKSKLDGALTAGEELANAKAELAALKESQIKAEVESLLGAAVTDGRMTPAQRPEFEALAGKYGIEALKAALSLAKPAGAAAMPPKTEEAVVESAQKTISQAPNRMAQVMSDLSAEQLAVIQKLGVTPEKYVAHRAKLFANAKISEEK